MNSKIFFFRCLSSLINLLMVAVLAACGGAGTGEERPENDLSADMQMSSQASDPVIVDLPIAYIKRSLPLDEDGDPFVENILEPQAFAPGAELYFKERASSEAQEQLLTGGIFEQDQPYDVKDLSVSFDGSKLLFSMRAPEIPNADEDEQPTWNIWEYDYSNGTTRRIISSDTTAEIGQDISPRYLADERIVFASTRQTRTKAILLDEGKPQYEVQDDNLQEDGYALHIMERNGTNIQQITFNPSHDLYPTPLEDGGILYLRWDAAGSNNSLSFYRINPDGSHNQFVYGFHSQNTGTHSTQVSLWNPVPLPDGNILAILKTRQSDIYGGDIVSVDITNFTEASTQIPDALAENTEAQQKLSLLEVTTDGSPSPHGLFNSAYPLYDGTSRYLVSWSQCRLEDAARTQILPCTQENLVSEDSRQAAPLYGLWMYDTEMNFQQPVTVPEEGIMYSQAVVMESRPTPLFIQDAVTDSVLEEEQVGLLNIRSVYDFGGIDTSANGIEVIRDPLQTEVSERPARFLRLEKAVPLPDRDTYDFDRSAFGRAGNEQMKEIVGYVEIEPDGSVLTKVPANAPLTLSILNADGHRISSRHLNWISVQVGEQVNCNGCHSSASEIAHGRPEAEPPSINSGAVTTGIPFPNTNPALFADIGETMAETYARINGYRSPSVHLSFIDRWTDPDLSMPAASFIRDYAELLTPAPTSDACISEWNALCRIVINYLEHIQPIWDLERPVLDDTGLEIENHRCTSCHIETDADGLDQVPAAQINLKANISVDNPDYATSYQELFFQNDEQELDEMGNLVFVLVESGLFELNAEGEQVLDEFGDPIPILVRVPVNSILRSAGALASNAFFAPFQSGASHEGYLSDVELKLISEWLDIGGQYYNNPFDAPEND